MSDPTDSTEDFAALFEASIKARRFKEGQTIEGTIVAIGPEVAFVDVGGKGEAQIDVDELKDEDGDIDGQCRRSHPGGGRVGGRRPAAVAKAGAWRRIGPSARGRVPRRPAGRRQGRERSQRRIRSPHRAAARRSVPSRRSTSFAASPPRTSARSTPSASPSSRKGARTWSSRVARSSRWSRRRAPPRCVYRSSRAPFSGDAWHRYASSARSSSSAAACRVCCTSPKWAGRGSTIRRRSSRSARRSPSRSCASTRLKARSRRFRSD